RLERLERLVLRTNGATGATGASHQRQPQDIGHYVEFHTNGEGVLRKPLDKIVASLHHAPIPWGFGWCEAPIDTVGWCQAPIESVLVGAKHRSVLSKNCLLGTNNFRGDGFVAGDRGSPMVLGADTNADALTPHDLSMRDASV